ncbi:MAG: galactose mutarotase [Bacteroidales bacterium]|nr:galactose mutarotase [Bacteroidales bacterium]
MKPSVYTLRGGNLEMKVTDYGARVLSLLVPDRNGVRADVIVGYETLEDYLACPGERFFGAAIGRVANRIGGARFTLDGKEYRLARNDNGNTLHGGFEGFDRVMWNVDSVSDRVIVFSLLDHDCHEGWPGNLNVKMVYELTEDNAFKVSYTATTDAPTLCNLTHHSFFNLTGDSSSKIVEHLLQISARAYLPVDGNLIPTGEVRHVEGTPFDFREGKSIGRDIDAAGGYDHNWCLDGKGLRRVATLYEPHSGRSMDVFTDQNGIQFYSGNFFDGSYAGKGGLSIGHRCALALETQAWPDAINHPGFPDIVLRPGDCYRHTCIYRFSTI